MWNGKCVDPFGTYIQSNSDLKVNTTAMHFGALQIIHVSNSSVVNFINMECDYSTKGCWISNPPFEKYYVRLCLIAQYSSRVFGYLTTCAELKVLFCSAHSSRSSTPIEEAFVNPHAVVTGTDKKNNLDSKKTNKQKEKDTVPIHCLPILWGSHTAMDFSQFRETGELSDITVS